MALNPSNSISLEQLALKGLIIIIKWQFIRRRNMAEVATRVPFVCHRITVCRLTVWVWEMCRVVRRPTRHITSWLPTVLSVDLHGLCRPTLWFIRILWVVLLCWLWFNRILWVALLFCLSLQASRVSRLDNRLILYVVVSIFQCLGWETLNDFVFCLNLSNAKSKVVLKFGLKLGLKPKSSA